MSDSLGTTSGGWHPSPPPPPPPKAPTLVVVLAAAIAVVLSGGVIGVAAGADTRPAAHLRATSATTAPAASPPLSVGTTSTPSSLAPPGPTGPGPSRGVPPLTAPPVKVPAVPSRAVSLPPAVIAAMVNPAVVDISARLTYQHAIATGTGMVLSSSGAVLTNNHVIAGATSIMARSVGTGRTYAAQVVGIDPSADVAIIQLEGASGLTPIAAGDSSAVAPGDPVVAIGNAGGVGGAPSVTTGTVEAVNQSIIARDPGAGTSEALGGLIESSAVLLPGDSGGPLANGSGQVIGMDTAASSGTSAGSVASVSFAIPIRETLSVAQQIQAGQASSTVHIGPSAFLGVQVAPGGGTAGRRGALVTGVIANSPAALAGLVPGDTITAVNWVLIGSGPALGGVLGQLRPGDRVVVAWSSPSGAARGAAVVLAAGPAG